MAVENRIKILQQADKLFKQGKIDAAIKEYQKIVEVKPDDLEVRRIIGDLYLKLNKLPEAFKQFEWISDFYLKEGFFTKAIAMYKRITRLDPQNESVSFKLADLYSKQGLTIEAKQIYLELAEEYKRQNNQKKALGIYKKILELDRGNIKMRILLADNYLREGMKEEAVAEYLTASDILIKKREFPQAEELLMQAYGKVKHLKIFEKLISCSIAQGNNNKAIQMLRNLGEEIYKHLNLLKILGELYFKNNLIEEAEHVYRRIAEIDSNETEVIMKLGKVYLQREEIDKAYQLFLPTIDRFIEKEKYDEANSLLRFIITSNNTYLPALNKLATIFKASKKTSSLIALYESLLPIYEQRDMKTELIAVLNELIELTDSPFAYQEQLARLTGEQAGAEEEENKQEREFIAFQLNNADQALKGNNFRRAADLLKTAQNAFPNNIEIRTKLFDVYQMSNDIESLLNEGIELMKLYKRDNRDEEYKQLLDKLTRLKPNDERLLDLSGHERTNIEIDFDHAEMIEQIKELQQPGMGELDLESSRPGEEDVFLLKGEDSLQRKTEVESKKGLSSHLAELDFYISEGYFNDAEKALQRLRAEYPESREIQTRLERVHKAKETRPDRTDSIRVKPGATEKIEIEPSIVQESDLLQKFEDSKVELRLDGLLNPAEEKIASSDFAEIDNLQFEIEMEEPESKELPPLIEIDQEEIIQAPSPSPNAKAAAMERSGSGADFLDIDNIFTSDEAAPASESPFRDIDESDLAESEVDILKGEGLFLEEEELYETEKLVAAELGAIKYWIDELQKQRTSTVEKNMMEIFKEFKKGVDEKIGQEDYDTRYNLGIAYKEMGLVEEAIHEFLISSKHPLKFFDSAGLLGICFREKGMMDEAIGWFEKALAMPGRKDDEYNAVKYEIVQTARLKEDFASARRYAADILKKDPNYRDIKAVAEELREK
ncbi:MAG TPA: tetratricopeptide repeat protein [Candidatus Aminicenantes bacterium]|nr:tetratricopeptide repeat protein [Candidatus Aminicenantes bacterium]